MAVNTKTGEVKKFSKEHILNQSFDDDLQTLVVQVVGYDGVNATRSVSDTVALKMTVVGSVTYVAIAAPGTSQSDNKWQCKKIDETTGTVITWCDGNSNFDNVASDLTALTYS